MIIGLVGGSFNIRNKIAQQIINVSNENAIIYSFITPDEAKTRCRARILLQSLFDYSLTKKLIIVSHLLTPNEVDVIRSKCGFIWHCHGGISTKIGIKKGDSLVTANKSSLGNFNPVEEVLGKTIRKSRNKQVA